MIIFIIGLFLILYCLLARGKYKGRIGFLFPLIIMGFQYIETPDFLGYKESFAIGGIGYTVKDFEFGWLWLNNFFQFAGFHVMIFFMAVVQCFICAYYVKSVAPKETQWLGVLLFFFCFPCMLMMMWALRQGMAIAFFVFAFCLAYKGKVVPSIVFGILSFSFHNSVAICLPILVIFLIVNSIKKKRHLKNVPKDNWMLIATAVALFILVFLKKTFLNQYLIPFAIASSDTYGGYIDELEVFDLSWWVSIYYCIHGMLFALLYKYAPIIRVFVILSIFSVFCNLTFFGIGNLMRVSNYFIIFTIATIPYVVHMLRSRFKLGKLYSFAYVLLIVIVELRNTIPWLFIQTEDNFHTYTFSFLH